MAKYTQLSLRWLTPFEGVISELRSQQGNAFPVRAIERTFGAEIVEDLCTEGLAELQGEDRTVLALTRRGIEALELLGTKYR